MEAVHPLFKKTTFDIDLLITALDTVSEGLLIVDSNYKVLYRNAAAEFLLGGIENEDPLPQRLNLFQVYDIKTRRQLKMSEMPIYRAVMGLKFRDHQVYVTTEQRKKGYYISCNGTPLIGRNNQIVGGVLTFRDITESYHSEKVLSQERAFFKNILDLIPANVFVKDELGNYFFNNQQFDDFWQDFNKLMDLNLTQIELIKQHDNEVKSKLKAMDFDEEINWFNGEKKIFKTIRFPLYHQGQNKVMICGIAFDVTEKVEMGRDLKTNA